MTNDYPEYMREAIALATASVSSGGGPFGCVIVKEGEVVGRGANRVVPSGDPTAHAEVVAIRDAARRLGTHDLSGCVLFASCEPCPMCLGAIYWAHISELYYANTQADAADIGFDDAFIYTELAKPPHERRLLSHRLLGHEAINTFNLWKEKEDKVEY